MDNKSIVIDGVDVSECKELVNECYCYLTEEHDYRSETPYTYNKCSGFPNCYYKQLKRKEQECKRLKNELSTYGATGICETCTEKSVLKYDQLEKENEKLKKERDTLSVTRNKLLGDLWVAEENLKDYIEHFNKASDELDQLKDVIKKYEECNKYLVEENGKTYTRLEYKLLRTLTEIKEIAKNGCYDDFGMPLDELSIILQKISECEV